MKGRVNLALPLVGFYETLESCKAFVQFVLTDDRTTADVQPDPTSTAALNNIKRGL